MAIPVGTVEHEEVVPGHDAAQIHFLEELADSACRGFHLFRLLAFRLAGILLAGSPAHGVLPSHAVLRQQPFASQARIAGWRRFKPEHLVARPASNDGVG